MIESYGFFDITPTLTHYDKYYLFNFAYTKHYKRDVNLLNDIFKGRNGYIGKYGKDGEYFIKYLTDINGKLINNPNMYSSDDIKTIIDFHQQPSTQPSLVCPWIPTKMGSNLYNKSNKKDGYNNEYGWLKWLIDNFFRKNEYLLNGNFTIEDKKTIKKITIIDNKIKLKTSRKDNFTKKNLYLTNNNNIIINNLHRKKTDHEIINQITDDTISKKINWTTNNNIIYSTEYKIRNIKISLTLVINNTNNKKFLNIYLVKNNKRYIFIKTIDKKELIKILTSVVKNRSNNYVI